MTKVTLDRTTFTQINTIAQRVQVVGGPILVAASATPTADDYHSWPEGAIVDVTAVKYAQALTAKPTWVITMAV